jgi:CheY-like chemotaxis protein
VKVEVSCVTFNQVLALSVDSKNSKKSDANWIRFKVTDTGRGIASKNIKRILDKFEQVYELSNQRVGGTGLGLAITKNLVEMQSGHLNVESKVGLGSVFTVDLPIQVWKQDQFIEDTRSKLEPLTLPSVTATNCDEHHKKCPIIVADDNEIGQFVADRMIKRWGYSVLLASDGKEAVDLWKANRPCLILMDIHMPKMNGYKATQAIRRLEKSGAGDGQVVLKSPILALTADAAEITATQLKKAGMDGHIPKPFDPKHLHSQIEQHAIELCRAFTSSGKTGE